MRSLSLLSAACLALLLSACAGVPFDYPKTPSTAIAPSGTTHWGAVDANWESEHGDDSGFVALSHGIDALGVRIKLMERAEATIDAQYFIVKRDRAGALFAGELLEAADRGVRVRLLVDDIFSPGVDEPFSLLSSHPNIEVRLFNPLSRSSPRYWNYAMDFRRANRRMHNKAFIVDNALAVVGGRNIGEEYFELNQDVKFDDFEVLTLGPVVEHVSDAFDLYWNSDLSVPMEAFGRQVEQEKLDSWRAWMAEQVQSGNSIYWQALESDLLRKLKSGESQARAAPATVVVDPPKKLQSEIGDRDTATLAVEMGRRFREARDEIVIITPYYIPQRMGADLARKLVDKGVRMIVITNSLASTNHVPVYSGYRRYRKELLEAGVEFYEIRPDVVGGESGWGHTVEHKTLHSKFTIIDDRTVFVGSLNFDPRSILINSEMGLFIESREAAGILRDLVETEMAESLYKVELDENGKLRWRYRQDGEEIVFKHSPLTNWWRRLQVNFYSLLPIESQL